MSTGVQHAAGPKKQPESPGTCSWCNYPFSLVACGNEVLFIPHKSFAFSGTIVCVDRPIDCLQPPFATWLLQLSASISSPHGLPYKPEQTIGNRPISQHESSYGS